MVGTSGWVYYDWEGIFYPEKCKDKLSFYSQYWKTVEINSSFYHLPREKTFLNWYNRVSADFVFAVKVNRTITHLKRLRNINDIWFTFLSRASLLQEKLGPLLIQFPASFPSTPENISYLEDFLSLSKEYIKRLPVKNLLLACEFRHPSWFSSLVYDLLHKYKVALVIADSSRYPKQEIVTADFVYVRMHGPTILFGSEYTASQLKQLARKIKNWSSKGLDCYIYFNNDYKGYAITNAKQLLSFLKL